MAPASSDTIISSLSSGITAARPAPQDLDKVIPNPGCPRANQVLDKEHPNGDLSTPPSDLTVLQQHVVFWDRDGDGIIWPIDTYVGFRRLGFNVLISLLAVPFIHGSFSYPSCNSWLPDPFFRVFVNNMHMCKHGSDSESYDTEGRFVPAKFEEIFTKYAKTTPNGLTIRELWQFTQGTRNIMDPVGWTAMKLEWFTLYLLCADGTTHTLSKDAMRAQYNGSLFYAIAAEREKMLAQRRKGGWWSWLPGVGCPADKEL